MTTHRLSASDFPSSSAAFALRLTTNGVGSSSHRGENSTVDATPFSARIRIRARAKPIRLNLSASFETPQTMGEEKHKGRTLFRHGFPGCAATRARPASIAVFEEILRKVNAPGRVTA